MVSHTLYVLYRHRKSIIYRWVDYASLRDVLPTTAPCRGLSAYYYAKINYIADFDELSVIIIPAYFCERAVNTEQGGTVYQFDTRICALVVSWSGMLEVGTGNLLFPREKSVVGGVEGRLING